MIRKTLWRATTALIVLSMAVPLVQAAPVPDVDPAPPAVASSQQPPPPRQAVAPMQAERVEEVSAELALSKIDPLLRDAAERGGKEEVGLYVAVKAGTDLSQYLSDMIVRPAVFGGTQNIYGKTAAGNLLKIAQEYGVAALVAVGAEMRDKPNDPEIDSAPDLAAARARLQELGANEVTYAEAQAKAGDVDAEAWFDVLDGHQSKEAWEKGFTGDGVIVGVFDDGVDFAHPDFHGTYATVTDPTSPYYGWPMAFSQVSVLYFVQDIVFGVAGIADGWGGSRWTDAQTTVEAHSPFYPGKAAVTYQPLGSGIPHEYTIPTTSQSNFYKLGSHPERHLLDLYGERVAVLVVDEHSAGTYDTVYVDLDNDYDFTDEKPVTRTSPEVYRDMDGDGYADISGGLLVWISDGANTPPTADWLWGITCDMESPTMKGCPDSGELVLFAGPFDTGYSHGTACAAHINSQGVIAGGLSVPSFRVGGMSQGAAPDAGVMDFGNHYYTGTDEDEYLVAALGYDGVPNSGDEVQITTHSYGNFRQMWGSWGYFGRLITALNMTVAPSTVWVFSSGNEGPGYGPQEGDGSPTAIQVGSSTQFGSTNWDSIFGADQIVYGDPSAFCAKGPNRDGSSGLDVLGNGGRGAASAALNTNGLYGDVIPFNGWTAWETWGGTSRSAPVAGGNLALLYEAFEDRYGRWPTWQEAKVLLKNSATNSVSSPFYQGAGVVNADRATDLAAGIYGVYTTPDEWQVGDWEGTEYLNFAKVAYPGDTFEKTYTVNNPSGYDISVDLSDGVMTLINKTVTSFTTVDDGRDEESGNFNVPDYLMKLDDSLIPADAELMVVRQVHPYDTYDAAYDFAPDPNNSWRFFVYNWTDQNGDGKLWDDADGDGVVGFVEHVAAGLDNDGNYRIDFADPGTEIQEGEYVRLDYAYFDPAQMIMVHDPLERMSDGYFLGWRHHENDGTVPVTTFEIQLEFYKRADWAWLSLSDTSLLVPAEGEAEFDAMMSIPAEASPGAYEGVVYISDPGDEQHDAHETALPVVVNVIAEVPDGGSVTLGGDPMADTLYQNSWSYGYFNWYGGGWTGAGDWRHYFLDIGSEELDAENLLIHTSWEDYPTDFNTWVLGPTDDCASNGTGQCAWYQPGLGQPNPAVFGPYTLQPIGWSEPFRSGAAYPFDTSTGGPDDWLMVPLEREGLHEIALHQVLFKGEELSEQFQVDVGTVELEPTMDPAEGSVSKGSIDAVAYAESGQIDLHFTPTLEVPDLEATLTGGLATTQYGPFTALVPDTGQCYSAWCDGNVYEEFVVDTPGATLLSLHLYMLANQDADFFLVYDSDDNGVPEQGVDAVVGSSGNSSGDDEHIDVVNPDLGRYWAVIDGYDVDPDSGVELDWTYEITAPGDLPTDPIDVFMGTVSIGQDAKFDPTTSSYSMTVTTNERVAALQATVTDIAAGADVDLYVTDEMGSIVAVSQNAAGTDEQVMLTPMAGEYRLEEGVDYTIWVHGFDVPAAPVAPTLHVWWDVHNLWLSASHPEVSVSAIGAGETVSVTLHFDKAGWAVGDPILSARLIAGPSVLPGAFDELVSIARADAPGEPSWNPNNLVFDYTIESGRGSAPFNRWIVNDIPADTALAQGGEVVTWTLTLTNNDPLTGTVSAQAEVDNWGAWAYLGAPYFLQTFGSIVVAPTYGTCAYDSYWAWVDWTAELPPGASDTCAWTATLDPAMLPGEDHLSILWAPGVADVADAYWRTAAGHVDGTKTSSPAAAAPGESFSYLVSLSNISAEDASVYFSDPLPDEVAFVSATGGATYDAGTHTVTWTGLVPGSTLSTADFEIVVQVGSGVAEGTVIENEATVADKLGGTPFATLEASTLVDDGLAPVLEIEKTVDQLTAYAGNTVGYTIVFENTGTEAAVNLVAMDPVPDYLSPNPFSLMVDLGFGPMPAPPGIWDPESHMMAFQAPGPVPPGQEYTLSYRARIDNRAPVGLAAINPAIVDADNAVADFDSALTEVVAGSRIILPMFRTNYSPAPATTITILHTNDTHAHLEPFQPFGEVLQGGVARRYTAIQQVKAEGGNVILVDAGDAFQGTLYFNVWQGEEEAYFMNALGYQAMAVGNHEFDSGPAALGDFIELADFPVLSANIDASAEPTLAGLIEAYTVLDVGGEQVGVFGLTTEETDILSSPGPNVVFNDTVATAQATVDELEGMGINKIVALTHLGYGPDQALAAAVDGIDVIVGGHSHTLLGSMEGAAGPYPTVVTSPAGDKVLIVSAQDWGRYLGRIDVGFTADGTVQSYSGEPIFLDESIAEDPTIVADVATFAEPIEDLKNTVIGESAVLLEGTRALVRSQETNLGNLICDAMLWATAGEGTQICIQNGGGIRASIPPGEVTMGQVLEVLPFGNQIATFGLTGADVWAALENGVSQWESGAGRFPQVAGLKYVFDPSLPAGSRIVSVDVKQADGTYEPLDLEEVYKLTSNNYMRNGGDGYSMFAENAIDPYDAGAVLADAVADYIAAYSPVSPTVEGRITKLDVLVTILHTNDLHGRFPTEYYYSTPEGVTFLASHIAAERAKNPNTLLLDAGDTFQGNAFAQYFRNATPNPIAGAMNMLDYDAMVIGNHEFNFGSATFATMLGQLDFPILGSANLDDDGTYGFINDSVDDYITLDVDGVKVSIFGLTNPEVPIYELPSNIEGLTFYTATTTAETLVPEILADEDPDLLVALTHIGYDVYKGSYDKDKAIAEQVPGIDVIVGGHSHTKLDPAVMITSTVNPAGTLVAQTRAYGQYLGKVNVGFTGNITDGYEIVFREGYLLEAKDTTEDAAMVAYLAPFEVDLEDYTEQVIGQTTAPIDALDAYTEETT
ncbi:MAG: 5'-nucleotidase C-terminal domain-containing protein, partial [Anaerolineae bacterium]